MLRNRGYKFRICLTQDQKNLLACHFGAVRWVYSRMLRLRSALFSRFKKGMTKEKPKGSGYALIKLLPKYKGKKKFAWLKEINT